MNSVDYLASALQSSFASLHQLEAHVLALQLKSGERVLVYLYDKCPTAREIGLTFSANSANQHYTLPILAGELFHNVSPQHNHTFSVLSYVFTRKAYTYTIMDESLFILPVYFGWPDNGIGYGAPVKWPDLRCRCLEKGLLYWTIAEFKAPQFWQPPRPESQNTEHPYTYRGIPHKGAKGRYIAQTYYDILGIKRTASREEVKQAYRALAQVFHPDLNGSPEANERMKQINEAYRQIIRK